MSSFDVQNKGCRNCRHRGYLTNYCDAYGKQVSLFTREDWKKLQRQADGWKKEIEMAKNAPVNRSRRRKHTRDGKPPEEFQPIGHVVDAEKCPRYRWGGTIINREEPERPRRGEYRT